MDDSLMQADPIPAVREDAATGATAAIFADLRATLGVPFVNLIWRHLATMPGVLDWTWAQVKPLQASDTLRAAADALRAGVVIPDGIRQPDCVYEAVGVTAAHRGAIAAMLRDYNAANAANLLSLLAAQAALAGPSGQDAAGADIRIDQVPAKFARSRPPGPRPPGPRLPGPRLPVPRLLGLNELSPATLALVLDLDGFGRFAATPAVASLYRHLGHWPGFLAVVHAALAAPHRDGRLRQEHARTRDRAQRVARERMLPLIATRPVPDDIDIAAAQASLQHFTGEMIARMVVMGETMLAMLPGGHGDLMTG